MSVSITKNDLFIEKEREVRRQAGTHARANERTHTRTRVRARTHTHIIVCFSWSSDCLSKSSIKRASEKARLQREITRK